jgi:transposase
MDDGSHEKAILYRSVRSPRHDRDRRPSNRTRAGHSTGYDPARRRVFKVLDDLGPRGQLRVCYEAGRTGYGLSRRLNELGICCVVVAPSLVPVQQGRRGMTDRRDAVKLAHFLRSGDLVEVSVPAAQNEAMRDLERAREDAVKASVSRDTSYRSS